jgi:alkanesulfonate monooxygenase SsuD/methylene tetrahydromethanopterin reductase-like flavin-dependent oxidoreductase (luciferase family)
MKFATSYNTAYYGVDPDKIVAYAQHAEATRRILLGTAAPYGVAHLPIHIGGSSRAAARRAGRRGDGYVPGGSASSTA